MTVEGVVVAVVVVVVGDWLPPFPYLENKRSTIEYGLFNEMSVCEPTIASTPLQLDIQDVSEIRCYRDRTWMVI